MSPEKHSGGSPHQTRSRSGKDSQKVETLAKIGLTTENSPEPTLQMLPKGLRIGMVFIAGFTQHEAVMLYLQQFGEVVLLLPGQVDSSLHLLVIASDQAPPPCSGIPNYPYNSFSTGLYRVQYTNMVKKYEGICPVIGMGTAAVVVGCAYGMHFSLAGGHDKIHPVTVTSKAQEWLRLDNSEFYVRCNHRLSPVNQGEGFVTLSEWKGVTESFLHHAHPVAGVMHEGWNLEHSPGSKIMDIYGYAIGDIVTTALIHYLVNLKS